MLEELKECPVCKNDTFAAHLTCTDHFLTKESFEITRCTGCSFLFTNPRPHSKELRKYYQSTEYISHSDNANNLTNKIYKIARQFTLKQKIKLINKITSDKTILDYGCGTGDFLHACKNNGWQIAGLEPDDFARNIAQNKTGQLINSEISQIKHLDNIGLITLWHVLEHLPDLNHTISILKSKLISKGKILIAVPNHESYDAQIYKERWAAYDVPRHLYHFSEKTMCLLLKKHGLKIVRKIPMKLDSFYVSLLSEKYKTGRTKYIKSVINGYKSNVYAKNNNNNYSSVIYIAGK